MKTHLVARCFRAFRWLAWVLALAPLRAAEPQLLLTHRANRSDGGADLTFRLRGDPGPKRLEGSRDLRTWTALGAPALGAESDQAVALTPGETFRYFRLREEGAAANDLSARVAAFTSASARLTWIPPTGATAIRVYLAPEPELTATDNPARRLLATLPGDAAEYEAAALAAATDAFFRIEAEVPGSTRGALVHARTIGGPRAALATRLREVHGFAPNVLQITLADGLTSNLKADWSVTRADGTPIQVTAVHRHSVPVSTPGYELGWCDRGRDVVNVDHRMFVVLETAIGSRDLLHVTGPGGLDFWLPYSDRYLETPVIQLNQLGYNPRATKRFAYVSGWMGDGGALTLANFPAEAEVLVEAATPEAPREARMTGLPVTQRSVLDPMAGAPVHEINLAPVPPDENARYRVRLPGVGVSWPTAVSEKAAFKAFYTVARGLFHNRCGGDLRADLTEWSRPADHPFVFVNESTNWTVVLNGYTNFAALEPWQLERYECWRTNCPGNQNWNWPFSNEHTPKIGRRAFQGGHHDAGDFDVRPFHVYVAQALLRSYEVAPAVFVDGQLHLPESGNGIPDLLDEALWSIQAWEQLQEEDGGVRLGVESYRHPHNAGLFAHEDRDDDPATAECDGGPLPYWTFGRDATHTARCAGLFAQAARLVAPFDAARAESLKQRALRAWHYATNHGAWTALRLYPAGELFRLTGEPVWREEFLGAWRTLGETDHQAINSVAGPQLNPSDFAKENRFDRDHLVAYLLSAAAGDTTAETLRNDFRSAGLNAADFRENKDENPNPLGEAHRNPRPWKYPVGFGQSLALGNYLRNLPGSLQLNLLEPAERAEAFNALSLAADYILGGNPNGLVYLTGLGTRRIEEPLHLDSLAFLKLGQGSIPGIPVYGPVDGRGGEDYVQATYNAFHPELGSETSGWDKTRPATAGHPVGRRHADVRLWVNANEFSVAEMQGPHTQLFALLMLGTHGVMPPASYLPGGADHRNPLP